MLISFLIIVGGLVLLTFGADLLVKGATNIAERFGMPDRIAGLTVCAVGTAMPEVFVSVTSAIEGHAEVAFGNVIGSCMANLLLILGLSAAVVPLGLSRRTQRFEIPVTVISIAALAFVANTGAGITFWQGAVLLALFAAFMAATVYEGLKEGASGHENIDPLDDQGANDAEIEQAREQGRRSNPIIDLALIAASIALLKFGADFVVDSAVAVAGGLGISERVIGITVVALGTCLPELVTSVVAAARGNTDLAVGNIVGSNITNILLVMGAPALFATVPYPASYNLDLALLAVFSAGLVACAFIGERHTFTRLNGVIYVFCYVVYIVGSLLA